MGGLCSTYEGTERCTQEFGGKPERKRPLARPMIRWENNNKMDTQEVERRHGLD